MTELRFEWDEAKNASNQRKHGISFEEAVDVFQDPLHVSYRDRVVEGEERWQTYGLVEGRLLVMVAHLLWEEGAGSAVRIISARQAIRQERRRYEEQNG